MSHERRAIRVHAEALRGEIKKVVEEEVSRSLSGIVRELHQNYADELLRLRNHGLADTKRVGDYISSDVKALVGESIPDLQQRVSLIESNLNEFKVMYSDAVDLAVCNSVACATADVGRLQNILISTHNELAAANNRLIAARSSVCL